MSSFRPKAVAVLSKPASALVASALDANRAVADECEQRPEDDHDGWEALARHEEELDVDGGRSSGVEHARLRSTSPGLDELGGGPGDEEHAEEARNGDMPRSPPPPYEAGSLKVGVPSPLQLGRVFGCEGSPTQISQQVWMRMKKEAECKGEVEE